MIDRALHIVDGILLKWKMLEVLEALVGALIITVTALFLGLNSILLPVVFLISAGLFIGWKRPWAKKRESLVPLIDAQLAGVEHSGYCLLAKQSDLSTLGQLQQLKVAEVLIGRWKQISLPLNPYFILGLILICSMIYVVLEFTALHSFTESQGEKIELSQAEESESVSMNAENVIVPEIAKLEIRITPPGYTRQPVVSQSNPELKLIEGSLIHWLVTLNNQIDSLLIVTSGTKEYLLKKREGLTYEGYARASQNGFYNFVIKHKGASHLSELFPIEVVIDEPPNLSLEGIDQRVELEYFDPKSISFKCFIEDDFGLTDAYIIATVSKGSGESVKFREERIKFDQNLLTGSKSVSFSKTIDISTMGMMPGDELYFYAEALDNRSPSKQKNRTSTFFITILDTTDIEFSLAGDLGIDVMPEYFRSQRQLIIDTEKLINKKDKLNKHDFDFTSNELGFDQKSLRIKYGQFMGEEFETDLSGSVEEQVESQPSDDPLEAFSHDHDGDNEHNLVEDHDHEEGETGKDDPLEDYQHVHDDPEEATFFTVTIKEKLRQALTEMWDAELYLRLYQPEKSLPYQYKALKLLKEIKNHARVYVHRIGFDPPPIKEENRLKGDLEDVKNINRDINNLHKSEKQILKDATALLVKIVESSQELNLLERQTLTEAGNILAKMAIDQPGKYLDVLDLLHKIVRAENSPNLAITEKAMQEMLSIVNTESQKPELRSFSENELTRLFIENLNESGN